MSRTQLLLVAVLLACAPGCLLVRGAVDGPATSFKMRRAAKHAWERYEPAYEESPYDDEIEGGFRTGYRDYVFSGCAQGPRVLPAKYTLPKYQTCFGRRGVQSYCEGYRLGIQAAMADCAGFHGTSGPKSEKTASGQPGASGCSCGKCAARRAASGAARSCSTGQCAPTTGLADHSSGGNCPNGSCMNFAPIESAAPSPEEVLIEGPVEGSLPTGPDGFPLAPPPRAKETQKEIPPLPAPPPKDFSETSAAPVTAETSPSIELSLEVPPAPAPATLDGVEATNDPFDDAKSAESLSAPASNPLSRATRAPELPPEPSRTAPPVVDAPTAKPGWRPTRFPTANDRVKPFPEAAIPTEMR